MKTFRLILAVIALAYAIWGLLHGEWLLCIQHSAFGWLLLLDPKRPGSARLRTRLMWVVLACAVLRFIF